MPEAVGGTRMMAASRGRRRYAVNRHPDARPPPCCRLSRWFRAALSPPSLITQSPKLQRPLAHPMEGLLRRRRGVARRPPKHHQRWTRTVHPGPGRGLRSRQSTPRPRRGVVAAEMPRQVPRVRVRPGLRRGRARWTFAHGRLLTLPTGRIQRPRRRCPPRAAHEPRPAAAAVAAAVAAVAAAATA